MIAGKKIVVAGHTGLVGSAIMRRLEKENCEVVTLGRKDADLRRQSEVEKWMEKNRPQMMFLAAAKVGGIHANNSYPAEFLYDNLMIETNLIHSAYLCGVEKLVFLGSTCIYPKQAPQPMHESSLLSGPLEPTNQWYAIAKIAGIKMCQAYREQYGCDFICVQPTNLYGPGDNFDLENSHVLPALMRKAHEAKVNGCKSLSVWGTGTPLREFLHVDDLADALVYLADNYCDSEIVNIGTGLEISIEKLARLVCDIVGFTGELLFDDTKPDGSPRKLCNVDKLHNLGWRHRIELREGLLDSYSWYLKHVAE